MRNVIAITAAGLLSGCLHTGSPLFDYIARVHNEMDQCQMVGKQETWRRPDYCDSAGRRQTIVDKSGRVIGYIRQ